MRLLQCWEIHRPEGTCAVPVRPRLSDSVLHRRGRLALNKEDSVDHPQTDCRPHNGLISVPNRNPGNSDERLICGNCRRAEARLKTYTRRTINSEAPATGA